jgi:hypothetical protein
MATRYYDYEAFKRWLGDRTISEAASEIRRQNRTTWNKRLKEAVRFLRFVLTRGYYGPRLWGLRGGFPRGIFLHKPVCFQSRRRVREKQAINRPEVKDARIRWHGGLLAQKPLPYWRSYRANHRATWHPCNAARHASCFAVSPARFGIFLTDGLLLRHPPLQPGALGRAAPVAPGGPPVIEVDEEP